MTTSSPSPSGVAVAEATDLLGHPANPDLLIDGDILLYRCGFAVERTKYLVENSEDGFAKFDSAKEAKDFIKPGNLAGSSVIWTRKEVEPVENAIEALRNTVKKMTDRFWPNSKTWTGNIFLTGRGNFRESIAGNKEYKGNRDPAHRPKHYKALKDYLINYYKASVVTGMEADDAIGIGAYSRPVDRYVIISNDKDLDQLSGFHYDWTKDHIYYVNDEEAIKMFYKQLLSGDPTDNIEGIAGFGTAKAAEVIDPLPTPKECAHEVKRIYEKKFGDMWEEKLNATGDLVWIRHGDRDEPGYAKHPFWEHLTNNVA